MSVPECAHEYEDWMDFDIRERRCKTRSFVDCEISPTYSLEDFSEDARTTLIIGEQAFLDIDDIPDTPERALALLKFKNAALWIMKMARIERDKKPNAQGLGSRNVAIDTPTLPATKSSKRSPESPLIVTARSAALEGHAPICALASHRRDGVGHA